MHCRYDVLLTVHAIRVGMTCLGGKIVGVSACLCMYVRVCVRVCVVVTTWRHMRQMSQSKIDYYFRSEVLGILGADSTSVKRHRVQFVYTALVTQGEKEMSHLTTHSTHFIQCYIASGIWLWAP